MTGRRGGLPTLLAALCASWLIAGAAGAEERVSVRVGEHAGYARLVFDWDRAPEYEARIEDDQLLVEFGRPARFDLSRLSDLDDYLVPPGTEQRGTRVTLRLRGAWELKHFPLESRVVLDLIGPGTSERAEPAAAKPSQSVPEQSAPAKSAPPKDELPKDEPAASVAGERSAASSDPKPEDSAPVDTADESSPLQLLAPEFLEAVRRSEVDRSVPPPRGSDDSVDPRGVVKPLAGRPKVIIDQLTGPIETAPRVTLEISLVDEERDGVAASATTPYFRPTRLRFRWTEEVPLAAFQRGQEVWLVFKATAPVGSVETLKSLVPELISVKRLDPARATVFRLEVPPLIEARVTASASDWLVDLRHQPLRPAANLSVAPLGAGPQSALSLPLRGAQPPIVLDDLERGGQVALIASAQPGQAFPRTRRYPGLSVLASLQGIAVQLDDPAVDVVSGQGGAVVRRPGGLLSLPPVDMEAARSASTDARVVRLFNLPAWRRGRDGEFERVERTLQSEIASAELGERLVARVELAKFYFAHGFTDESLGVLQLLESERRATMLDPELLLLTAAGHILRQDYEKGALLLGHPSLAGEGEARLWEALLAAERENWPLAAYRFNETYDLIEDYLPPVRTRLFLRAAEAAMAIGDRGEAMRLLKRSEEEELSAIETAEHDYVLGLILMADDQPEESRKLLKRVAGGRHGYASVKARMALIDKDLEQEALSVEEAIVKLEQLRFAWRGDEFEFALLKRIADLNESLGRYRETLRTLRSAAAHFPHLPEHEAIGERMSRLFRELFLGDRGEALAPLAALSLYEEFRELSPGGEEGSRLVGRLADRLVEVDLLGRATELLEEQITFRLSGLEKARVGARLALIYMLDRRPREALAALDRSAVEDELPLGLDRQRVYLRAHALVKLDRGFEALALIEDDVREEADRLRVEILWELREWKAVAELIEGGLPDPDTRSRLSEAVSGDVLSLAVALTLGNESERLAAVQRRWGEVMAQGPHAESFALLSGDLSSEQVGSIARELAKVTQARAFMTSYRESFDALGEAADGDDDEAKL